MSLSVQVLGCANAWAAPGGATSGYLLRGQSAQILLDCGHGVLAALRAAGDPYELDAIAISHLHADHVADLIALAYMLRFHPDPRAGHRPRLLLPAGELERLRRLGSVWDDPKCFESAFAVEELAPDTPVKIGDLTVTGAWVPHALPTMAFDVRAAGGGRTTYGADCSPNADLERLAAGTDLLLVEATMPEPGHGHLSALTAGQLAARAKARRCVLVHVCDAYDLDWVAEQGQAGFGAAVTVAQGGMTFTLGAGGR